MDLLWPSALLSLGIGVGLAAAAGLRVFLPLLVLGLAARNGVLPLTDAFGWIASTPGIAALATASAIEVIGYYIPLVDNVLDMLAAPLAILAGIVLTAAVTTDLPPELRWAAAIVAGGGTAGLVQAATSLARLKSTAFTGGLANPILATLELVGSLATAIVAVAVPLLGVVLVIAIVMLIRRLARSRTSRTRQQER